MLSLQEVRANNYFNLYDIGKNKLTFPNEISIEIVKFNITEDENARYWKSMLIIKKGNNILAKRYPILKQKNDNLNLMLVPIKDGRYILDLNNDKYPEFAVALEHGGNAPSTTVGVFSLKKDKINVYKYAWYQQENGKEVIWDYSKAPKKCYYTSQDKCKYL